ncbi:MULTISPECIES: hypothetical protein [unclassified Streptomyces]|uniref:hypothetical protein n=1 Tax=unclassified Streptomyces TaxID=2593676 RepID=UPI00089D73FB|nr:hypothetical protein [Streptomyces sp. 2131.1]SEC06747.1 hypothetical protein SAMN05216483_0991 [Streptomyces sp. 2131.1]
MRMSASARSRSARAVAAIAVAAATLGGASAAFAAPGDSGDIDIRPGGWAARGGDGNEVCKFVLQASNFGDMPAVPWTITAQPPTVPPGDTLASTLPLVNGSARSQEYLLPEGTYQLVWIVPSGPKNKAFKVDCTKPSGNHGSSENSERGSSASGSESGYEQPSGGVPAGGGGVPDMEGVSSESDSNVGTTAAIAAGAAGAAGLIMVRRAARRRARNEA